MQALHTGHWPLHTALDTGHYTGHWTLDTGHWTLHWTLDTVHRRSEKTVRNVINPGMVAHKRDLGERGPDSR